jgi:hypothetical protein
MAFLDNSGDIILDAVLTDTGRKALAEGNGSFQITKFGLADDEIDYSLYDVGHLSGSPYFDLEILQTPILEAFTDNAAMLKYNLVTYNNLEYMFLPVLLLNESDPKNQMNANKRTFYVCANGATEDDNDGNTTFNGVAVQNNGHERIGFMFGSSVTRGGAIRVDQGLNTDQIAPTRNLDTELKESTYILQMDSKLGNLADINGNVLGFDYKDDDGIAYYTVTNPSSIVRDNSGTGVGGSQVIRGPRGTIVQFKIQTSMELQSSNYLFQQLGGTEELDNRADPVGKSTVYYIDSTVKLTGTKTGCTIDIPVRYIRLA